MGQGLSPPGESCAAKERPGTNGVKSLFLTFDPFFINQGALNVLEINGFTSNVKNKDLTPFGLTPIVSTLWLVTL